MKTRTLSMMLAGSAGLAGLALAAPFSVDWWTIDSGGGTSKGGRYAVTGTIGQADTGYSEGGSYSVTGGFWSPPIQVIQVDGLPELRITRVNKANVVLTWTENGTPLTVEESPDFKPGTWSTTGRPIFSSGDDRQIIIPGATGRGFFRLKRID